MLGIVLTRHDLREADQQISLYTDESGKIEVLAKSVKKITSRNSSHLEPYTLLHIDTTWGKEKDILTSVQSIESFAEIRRDLFKHASALFTVRAVDAICKAGERDERIFGLLHDTLVYIRDERITGTCCLDIFFLRFASLLGFEPAVDVKQKKESYVFSLSQGSIVDQVAARADQLLIQEPVRDHIQQVLRTSVFPQIFVEYEQEFHNFVFNFIRFHLYSVVLTDWKSIEKFA